MELLPLLCLCLLTRSGVTSAQLNGPVPITVEEDRDVMLPCSLSNKEDITSGVFDWKKDGADVFFYANGRHSNNGRGGQIQQFIGRVSHFEEELKHGNASITIRNTKVADSGNYTCFFPNLRPPQTFKIELVVGRVLKDRTGENIPGAVPIPSVNSLKATKDWALLQCKVHGNPEPEVEWQDSAGNKLPAEKPQGEKIGDLFSITLNVTVTKTDLYRCVSTQETISHQISAEISVYISGEGAEKTSGSSTGWIVTAVIAVLVVVVGVAYLAIKRFRERRLTVIKALEGSDVILPCSLWPKEDLRLTRFVWEKTDGGQEVFLYDNDGLNSDERPGQNEQFKGRVSHFPDELEQGNASITIRNTTRADSGDYRCSFPSIQKPKEFYIKLVVGSSINLTERRSLIKE